MTLKGDLDSISLADVFQTLSMTQQEGTLFVQDGETRKAIYFAKEGVRLVTTGERKAGKLGDMLVGLGKITIDQLEEALSLHRDQDLKLGEALIRLGFVTDKDIEAAVRVQIEEEIYDLFSWEGATFEFVEGPPPQGTFENDGPPVTQLTFHVNSLIMEAARRIDEWDLIEKVIPTMREIFVLGKRLNPMEFTDQEQMILRLVDGQHSVKEIVTESHVPKFEVCKFLYRMIEDGKAQRAPFESLLEYGDAAVQAENLNDAVKFYEQALTGKVKKKSDMNKARQRYAQALEYLDRKKEAADQYKILADSKIEDRDLEGAINIWQKVIDLNPLDLENKERLINVYLENREHLDPNRSDVIRSIEYSLFKNGKSLAMAFAYAGQIDRAKEVLDNLLELAPSNVDLRKALANIHLDAGEKAEAVENLEKIAHFLVANRDYGELLEVYKKILKIDPSRGDIRKKISMIEAGETLHHDRGGGRGWGKKIALILVVLIVLGGLVAVGYYQMTALQSWETAERDAQELWKKSTEVAIPATEKEQLRKDARAKVQEILDKFPHSMAVSKAKAQLDRWVKEEEDEKEQEETLLRTQATAVQAVFRQMEKTWVDTAPLDVDRIEKEIDKAARDARNNPYAEQDVKALLEIKKKFRALKEEVEGLLSAAKAAEDKAVETGEYRDHFREAWTNWAELYKRGTRFPALWEQVEFPVRFETVPAGAKIYINGEGPSKTPYTHRVKPDEPLRVKIQMPGYHAQQGNIPGVKVADLTPEDVREACLRRFVLEIDQLCEPLHVDLGGEKVKSDPAAAGGRLFLAVEYGRLSAIQLDEEGLKQIWKPFRPSSDRLRGGFISRLFTTSLHAYFPCEDGKVYRTKLHGPPPTADSIFSYDAAVDTEVIHTIRDRGGAVTSPDERFLVIGTDRGLGAFDISTGKLIWRYTLENDDLKAWSIPAVHEGKVYAGLNSGTILAFDLNGSGEDVKPLWQVSLGNSPIRSALIVVDGILYVGSEDGNLVALDLSKMGPDAPKGAGRTTRWFGEAIRCRPLVLDDKLLALTSGGYLFLVEQKTLKPVWKFQAGGRSGTVSDPSRRGPSIYLGNEDGVLFAVDWKEERLRWERKVSGKIKVRPAVDDEGNLFVVSEDRKGVTITVYRE